MAKDWIKMRMDLPSHPKVVRILSATKSDKFRVIGGLHAVWSVFDIHSQDGELVGYTPKTMDHIIGWDGFSDAMIAVGWMSYDGRETLTMPDFDTHNGQSSKRRAEETERKRKSRSFPQSGRKVSDKDADEMRSREEESRREESNNIDIVISYLNDATGKNFRGAKTDRSAISARLSEGYTIDQIKSVIDRKAKQWGGDPKMDKYLRPSTLFRPSSFEGYVNESDISTGSGEVSELSRQIAEIQKFARGG